MLPKGSNTFYFQLFDVFEPGDYLKKQLSESSNISFNGKM